MATFIINNIECEFKGIAFELLHHYQPTQATYLVAWAKGLPSLDMAILSSMDCAAIAQMISQKPFMVRNDDGCLAYLVENPHARVIEYWRWWLGAMLGTAWTIVCPYQQAKVKFIEDMEEKGKQLSTSHWMLERKIKGKPSAKEDFING